MLAINCTGPTAEIGRLRFQAPFSRILGEALATADYVAQLSDPLYPDKLGRSSLRIDQSDEYAHVPENKRAFKTEAEAREAHPPLLDGLRDAAPPR